MKITPIINNVTFLGRYHNDNQLRKIVKEPPKEEKPEPKEPPKGDLRAMAKQSEERIQKEREMQNLLSRPQKYRKEN